MGVRAGGGRKRRGGDGGRDRERFQDGKRNAPSTKLLICPIAVGADIAIEAVGNRCRTKEVLQKRS